MMKFTRITVRPDQMGGVPCLRGLRIPVATHPDLEAADIEEALHFAAEAVRERALPLATAAG